MSNPAEADPLRIMRKDIVETLQPMILRALGVKEADVTSEVTKRTFALSGSEEIECSASKIGSMLLCGIKMNGPATVIFNKATVKHSVLHELIGESDITKTKKFEAFDSEGQELNEAELSEICGSPMGPMEYTSDELGIFDDYPYLFGVLFNLDPSTSSDIS